jgi:hypothetical protein
MLRTYSAFFVATIALSAPAWGQPRQWVDDFTTIATYNSDSDYGTCRGGSAPKYTVVEGLLGDIFNARILSGGGTLSFTNRSTIVLSPSVGRKEFAVCGWLGLGVCPGGPPTGQSTEPFTSGDICVFGAIRFNHFQCKFLKPNGWDVRGADGKPGVADVDDDQDGTTDEWNESLAHRPTTVNNGYGNRNGTGFQAGLDAAPGVAGVDDDGNGIVDDVGETGWAGSDDGDDTQRHMTWICLKANINAVNLLYLNFDAGSTGNTFGMQEVINGGSPGFLEFANEIVLFDYYTPEVKYNWVFCVAGYTCLGAVMWHEADMANPAETLGPVSNSSHTGPGDQLVGFGYDTFGGIRNPIPVHFKRQVRIQGNSNFADAYWVVSGLPASHYPSPSADLDMDRDVDGFDFLTFSNCYNGSNKPPLSACANAQADLDDDGDVDGFDFLTFSNCYNGSNRKPLTACFPPNLTACGS